MIVRKISAADIGDLVLLFDQYMVFYKQASAPEKYKNYLLQRINDNDASIYMAWDENEKAAGFVLNYHSFSSVSQGRTLILNDLFVAPDQRNMGIATELIACSVALAKEVGALRVDLATAKDNINAQAFYEKLGFTQSTEYFSYNLSID
ncbi:MAG: GNAT family N-acetyltransferase [Gammaproteobacteria bacterium]|nr:GNAT family N-acetyltransferase [Gammaproteobacteria bacterium]